MAIAGIYSTSPFDPSCARYTINGVFPIVGVMDFNFDPGASAEYYYSHGYMVPRGITRTKFDPSGDIEIMALDANTLEDYLFTTAGGSQKAGGVSEVSTTLVALLDNTQQQIQFTFQQCRFLPKGMSFGASGSNSPISKKYSLKFLNITEGVPGNERPMAISPDAIPI